MSSSFEESLEQRLEELQKQLGKKQQFEEAIFSINCLLQNYFSSASPSLRKWELEESIKMETQMIQKGQKEGEARD